MESLLKQIRKINKHDTFCGNVKIVVQDDCLYKISLHITVEEGIHQGANYIFGLELDEKLFLDGKSPKVTCETPVYHPNMNYDRVCLNLLSCDWVPGTTLESIIAMLYCLLENPEFDNALSWSGEDEPDENYEADVQARL